MSNKRILVIGDVLLDRFVDGTVFRMAPEGPVPVLSEQRMTDYLGGAANVALNLKQLECEVDIIGVVGDDAAGKHLNQLLTQSQLSPSIIIPDRKTTLKTRYLDQGKQLLRVDYEQVDDIDEQIVEQILVQVEVYDPELIVISDYAKGVITSELMKALQAFNLTIFVDPKGLNWEKYHLPFLIKPNFKEIKDILPAIEDRDQSVSHHLTKITDTYAQHIVLTRGRNGMSWSRGGTVSHHRVKPQNVFDVTGAGDTAIAVLSMAYMKGKDLNECIFLANLASSYVITQPNTYAITRSQLDRLIKERPIDI